MNFLGHAWLSRNQPPAMQLGNLMGDFLSEPKALDWTPEMKQGLSMHRFIDQNTDAHPSIREARSLFFPTMRHYAAVVVDVLLDHYLANRWQDFAEQDLDLFCKEFYHHLEQQRALFSMPFVPVFNYMKHGNWLKRYGEIDFMADTIRRFQQRRPNFLWPEETIALWRSHDKHLKKLFLDFLPDMAHRFDEKFPV